ncbi:hypothetical protein M0657_002349 [Pyricularia oryzae]|nr:hypothetical protein M9X92_006598 [Pyricularia oryzae]KAI7929091.1 hypothetical protein M0657_002349 [Pyricularia oryzae]
MAVCCIMVYNIRIPSFLPESQKHTSSQLHTGIYKNNTTNAGSDLYIQRRYRAELESYLTTNKRKQPPQKKPVKMPAAEVRRLTKHLTTAAQRDVATEADKMRQTAKHAGCSRRNDKYTFGCRCRAERGRLLGVWDEAVANAAEHLRRQCRRQLMKWELAEVRLHRRLTRKQKRAGRQLVFAPGDMDTALVAVREAKLRMLADDLELERAAPKEDASSPGAEEVGEEE